MTIYRQNIEHGLLEHPIKLDRNPNKLHPNVGRKLPTEQLRVLVTAKWLSAIAIVGPNCAGWFLMCVPFDNRRRGCWWGVVAVTRKPISQPNTAHMDLTNDKLILINEAGYRVQ